MKTTLCALAVLAALTPQLTHAGGIFAAAPRLDVGGSPSDDVGNAVNDAIAGQPQLTPSAAVTDAINGAVLGSPQAGPANGAGDVDIRHASAADRVILTCVVMGTPNKRPDDLRIRNAGLTTLRAGAEIAWRVANAGAQGHTALTRDLPPSQVLRLNGVLDTGLAPGTGCSAEAL